VVTHKGVPRASGVLFKPKGGRSNPNMVPLVGLNDLAQLGGLWVYPFPFPSGALGGNLGKLAGGMGPWRSTFLYWGFHRGQRGRFVHFGVYTPPHPLGGPQEIGKWVFGEKKAVFFPGGEGGAKNFLRLIIGEKRVPNKGANNWLFGDKFYKESLKSVWREAL